MGLNVICNNISKSVGTYHEVDLLKKNLIDASIKVLRTEDDTDDYIDYFRGFLDYDGINYSNYSMEYNNILKLYKLYGIIIFIMKNENNNVMSIGESVDFMCSIDYIKDNIDIKYFNGDKDVENFYLAEIFMNSIKNHELVEFF